MPNDSMIYNGTDPTQGTEHHACERERIGEMLLKADLSATAREASETAILYANSSRFHDISAVALARVFYENEVMHPNVVGKDKYQEIAAVLGQGPFLDIQNQCGLKNIKMPTPRQR